METRRLRGEGIREALIALCSVKVAHGNDSAGTRKKVSFNHGL